MRKLLFAATDPRDGEALRAVLQAHRHTWEAHVVSGAEAAHGCLHRTELDAVVADLGTECGRSTMAEALESFPEVVRIGIVSRRQVTFNHLSAVHQTVSEPLDLQELEVALERSCRMRDLLKGERICGIIGELRELPPAPAAHLRLVRKLNQPNISIGEIADIVEGDVATAAKLLQVVNSVVFRTSREIATVKTAASFLGTDAIKNVVLSLGAFQAFENMSDVAGCSLDALQGHCQLTAAIAAQMALPGEVRDAAIVAALLHDIGKLVIACKLPDRFARLLARARAEQQPLYRIEEQFWGITHAEIGAYLLGLWGLPIRVTEAIAYHHAPAAVPHTGFDALSALYVANLLAHEQEGTRCPQEWDLRFLEDRGVLDRLPAWKTMAEQTACLQPLPTL